MIGPRKTVTKLFDPIVKGELTKCKFKYTSELIE